MGIEFTKEQQRVIDARGRNVLVSAAAGSGKTAVLVERIIRMIMDDKKPMDIDRLLVVTFTEAAAAEMKERIGKALSDAIARDPSNIYLQKQSALLYRAQISTIHSFCLNIIRNNFNEIGIDPGFRIADETELKLMREDVLNSLFEEMYASKDADFSKLVDYYSDGVKDDGLKEDIYRIYDFAEGQPWPADYLKVLPDNYNVNAQNISTSKWGEFLYKYAISIVDSTLAMIEEARKVCTMINGPIEIIDNLDDDAEKIKVLKNANDIDKLRQFLEELKFGNIKKTSTDVDDILKKKATDIRAAYKDMLKSKSKSNSLVNLLSVDTNTEANVLNKMYPVIFELVKITISFSEKYKASRIRKGIISFSDMEHYALEILYSKNDAGERIPSTVAIEYREAFDEILMDEYQDCNRVQEALLSAVSKEADGQFNRFMVGDIKQSIYKFRLANPELFINKYNSYIIDDLNGQRKIDHERIDLHANFRSRESVIKSVNELFGQIMHEDLGGVEYNEEAALVCRADYPELNEWIDEKNDANIGQNEFLLCELDSESDQKKSVQEATMIASKIKSLIGKYPVTDKATGKLRAATYRDITILVRSMTDVADGLKQVLSKEGIPCVINLSSGFYDAKEVQNILQFLKVIDNPLQDIPLYGVMHSPFVGMKDQELSLVRARVLKDERACDIRYLYEELIFVNEYYPDEFPKVHKFLEYLNDLRRRAAYTPIHNLIKEIVDETGYADYVLAMAGGEQRKANINQLIAKAAMFESTSYKGLFHFNRYIKELRKINTDEGEADIADENADVVRIMTIHKSKGLEFPICFLSGIHKKFNKMDTAGNISLDMDFGIGSVYVDLDKRIKYNTLYRKAINQKLKLELVGEELRVLYVALTRAKEKLIVTGVIDDADSFLEKASDIAAACRENSRMPYRYIVSSDSYLDLMMGVLDKATIIRADNINEVEVTEAANAINKRERLLGSIKNTRAKDNTYKNVLSDRFNAIYPYMELRNLVPKTSVSELKKAYLDTEFSIDLFANSESKIDVVPGFAEAKDHKLSGTDRGSAYHKVMELLDFSDSNVKSQINNMINNTRISKEWAYAVPVKKIELFLSSELGKRMEVAQNKCLLYREQPFVLGISADRVSNEYPDTETVLLQGIIDAYFIEGDQIVLVDYKTDVVKDAQELVNRYRVQVQYYKEALERITGLKVKESILYSFHLGTEVKVLP